MKAKKQKLLLILLLVASIIGVQSCNEDDNQTCTDPDACTDITSADGTCIFICLTDSEKSRVTEFVATAIEHLNNTSQEEAFEAFDELNGNFVSEELYIFVMDMNATMLSHGFQHELIGQNLMDLQDIEGKYFIRDMFENINQEGEGWTWYYWDDPVTNSVRKKFSFVKRFGDLVVGSGTYK